MKTGKATPVKQAAIAVAAIAFGWMAIEMAFKPLMEKVRAAMDKSDPNHDPDETAAASDARTKDVSEENDGSSDATPVSYAADVVKNAAVAS